MIENVNDVQSSIWATKPKYIRAIVGRRKSNADNVHKVLCVSRWAIRLITRSWLMCFVVSESALYVCLLENRHTSTSFGQRNILHGNVQLSSQSECLKMHSQTIRVYLGTKQHKVWLMPKGQRVNWWMIESVAKATHENTLVVCSALGSVWKFVYPISCLRFSETKLGWIKWTKL